MQVCMLNLFFLCFCTCTNRNRAPYILQVLNFVTVFLENILPVLYFTNFLKGVGKVTKNLKAVETEIFNLSFWKKKFYRNINNMEISALFHISMQLIASSYGVTTVTRHYHFHTDQSIRNKNGNIITKWRKYLVHLVLLLCQNIIMKIAKTLMWMCKDQTVSKNS